MGSNLITVERKSINKKISLPALETHYKLVNIESKLNISKGSVEEWSELSMLSNWIETKFVL